MSTLYVVSTPIGNLGDLTERAGRVLSEVDRIFAEDTRRTGVLLDHLALNTPLRSLHAHNEAARTEEVLELLEAGESAALVSDSGTPLISDPGERVVAAVIRDGYRVVPVPGPSAVLAALVGSGLPTGRFTFLGFPPRKGGDRTRTLESVAAARETVVLFESPERLLGLLEDLERACGPERRVAVARELTKIHEEFERGTIPDVHRYYQEHPPRGEVVVLVEATPEPTEPDEVDEVAARALARALLDEGLRASGAAREVSRRLGIPRNLAYDLVHSLNDA